MASESFTSDLPKYLAAEPDLSGGIVAKGTEYNMNTVPGVWFVESASDDEIVVSIGSGFVVDGSLSPSLRSTITVSLEWSDGGWVVSGAEGTRTVSDLYEIGTTFTGGC